MAVAEGHPAILARPTGPPASHSLQGALLRVVFPKLGAGRIEQDRMSGFHPSSAAIGAATLRATHLLLDEAPWPLEDRFALRLPGLPGGGALRGALSRLQQEFAWRRDKD